MVFFFKPPRGNIALHTVKDCVHQRLEYLKSIIDNDDSYKPEKMEYLITGSSMDRMGHYILRLIALSSVEIKDLFLKAETKLFGVRIKLLNSKEIWTNLRISARHISEGIRCSRKHGDLLVNLKLIFEQLTVRKVIEHTFSEDHSEECEQYRLKAPFTMCLSLVRQRKVYLEGGVAHIPCGRWKIFLLELFEKHLIIGMEQLVSAGCYSETSRDPRIRELRRELEKVLQCSTVVSSPDELKACDVDYESTFFPVCMMHLHRTLRSRHRLSHEWRRQYTLFLKGIGMPIDEAVLFWSKEYSQPKEGSCSSCCHSWQKDAKRFLYSIRHMYGLEGGRYHYVVASCKSLQASNLGPSAEGGCPFKHFDEDKLLSYFPPHIMENDIVLEEILELKKTDPQKACQTHLQALSSNEPFSCYSRNDGEDLFKFNNPAHYYFCFKNS